MSEEPSQGRVNAAGLDVISDRHGRSGIREIVTVETAHGRVLMAPELGLWQVLRQAGASFAGAGRPDPGEGPEDILRRAARCRLPERDRASGLEPTRFSTLDRRIRYVPYFATLNLTDACSLRCEYCYNGAGSSSSSMACETAMEILRQMSGLDNRRVVVLFHGGEPLESLPLIRRLIRRQADQPAGKPVTFAIQTNGLALSLPLARELHQSGVGIGVSLDGLDQESNRFRRLPSGHSSLQRVLRNLGSALQDGLPIGVVSLLTRANAHRVGELVDGLIGLGVRRFSFNHLIRAGRGLSNLDTVACSAGELVHASKVILDRVVAHNRGRAVRERVSERNLRELVNNLVSSRRRFMCLRSPCGAGCSLLGFAPDGQVYPCDDLSGVAELELGNIHEIALSDALADHPAPRLLRSLTVDRIEPCSSCPWRWICGGGCASKRYYATGRLDLAPPCCEYYSSLIPYLMERIDRDPAVAALV